MIVHRFFCFLSAVLLVAAVHTRASASSQGTADEAQAMVERALTLIETDGTDAAYATFTAGTDGFRDRDLYVFVIDYDGVILAHGANAKLIGKNIMTLKDSDGKAFVSEFVEVARGPGAGWVDYKWPDPQTKKIRQKSSYLKKAGDTVVGVGIYK